VSKTTLREAHMAENDEDENDYVQSLEETVSELQARLEEVTEERDTLKNESMEIISKLAGTIESQNDRIESLESTVENRLPEPDDDEDDEDSGWFFW
jgi:DNA anti-recombination protein RmuC